MTPRIYLDTNFFIATFELADRQSGHGWSVLNAIENGALVAVTSELTLAELLPKPIAAGDAELVATYHQLLVDGSSLRVVPVSRTILIEAAERRAVDRTLKLPDAIHLATALSAACSSFITEDLRLRLPAQMRCVRLTSTSLQEIGGVVR